MSSEYDVKRTKRALEHAEECAAPIKDPGLKKKIHEALEHVVTRIDPKAPEPEPTDDRGGGLSFCVSGGREVLRFTPNGQAYVRGELVACNKDIYEGFCAWLTSMNMLPKGNA